MNSGMGNPDVRAFVLTKQKLKNPHGTRICRGRDVECPPKLYESMYACWNFDAECRPTFAALKSLLDNFYAANYV